MNSVCISAKCNRLANFQDGLDRITGLDRINGIFQDLQELVVDPAHNGAPCFSRGQAKASSIR